MVTCPNCGSQNNDGDRFCSSCGVQLEQGATDTPNPPESTSTPPPPPVTPSTMPPPINFAPPPGSSIEQEEEWRMSSLGPPPSPKRRIWLWILIGVLALCVLSCVGLIGFSMTDTGREWIEGIATEAAQQATEAADGP